MSNAPVSLPAPTMDVIVGRQVKKALIDRGLKQNDLHQWTKISQSRLSKLLSGKLGWSPSDLMVTSYAIDVTMEYLMGISATPERLDDMTRQKMKRLLPGLDSNQEPIGYPLMVFRRLERLVERGWA